MNNNVKTPNWLLEYFKNYYDPCPFKDYKRQGLKTEWKDYTYVNPPYSNPKPWIEKAIKEANKGKHIIMLLRVDPSTQWYKLLVEQKHIHIAYFNERIFKGSNFCSMLVFIEGKNDCALRIKQIKL